MPKEACTWCLCIRGCVGSVCDEVCWEGSVPKRVCVWGLCARIYVYKGKSALLVGGPETFRSRAGTPSKFTLLGGWASEFNFGENWLEISIRVIHLHYISRGRSLTEILYH